MRTENVVAEFSGGCWEDPAMLPSADSDSLHRRHHGVDDSSFDRLVRVVESEIVPRLVIARRAPRLEKPAQRVTTAARPDVLELVRLLLAHDASVALAHVLAISEDGMPVQDVCLQLLAPAARVLGEMWERDECDFVHVTLGLCKLHQVLHQLGTTLRSAEESGIRQPARRVLLAAAPGEQHTFGIVMVGQFFRADGWDVWNEFPETESDLMDAVHDCWFALVGLSVGSDVRLSGVAAVIQAIRRASCNHAVRIMLGGPILVRSPELAPALGADTTALDGRQAVLAAQAMFTDLAPPS